MSGSIVQSDLDHHHAEDLERSGNSRTPVEDESAPDPVLAVNLGSSSACQIMLNETSPFKT